MSHKELYLSSNFVAFYSLNHAQDPGKEAAMHFTLVNKRLYTDSLPNEEEEDCQLNDSSLETRLRYLEQLTTSL